MAASGAVESMTTITHQRCLLAMKRFVGSDPGRSIAAATLSEPRWSQGHSAAVPRPAASVLKVPLVIAVHRAAGTRPRLFDDQVRVDELPTSRFASVLDVLASSHRFTVRELCGLALATSDNRIASYLLGIIEPGAVEEVLHDAGCEATRLDAGFADHELGRLGRTNVSTADDMLRLLRHLYQDPSLRDVRRAMERCPLNARIPLRLPDDERVSVANKTGSLAGVCNDIAIIEEGGLVLAVAVLCDSQPDIARTSIDIGDCARELWAAHGGRLES